AKTSQPSPRKAVSLTKSIPNAKRREERFTRTPKRPAYRNVDRPMAEPPTTIPHPRSRAGSAAASPSTRTSTQRRIWIRPMLGGIADLLEAPQHLDQAHECAGGRDHGQDDRSPGGPPEMAIEEPAEERPGGDRTRELECHRHATGVPHRGGRVRHVNDPSGPGVPLRPADRSRAR